MVTLTWLSILTWWFCDSSVVDPRLDLRNLGIFIFLVNPKFLFSWVFSLIHFQDIDFGSKSNWRKQMMLFTLFCKEVILETKENRVVGETVVDCSTSWPSYFQQTLLTKGFFYKMQVYQILIRIFYFSECWVLHWLIFGWAGRAHGWWHQQCATWVSSPLLHQNIWLRVCLFSCINI
jgi:hypothetical protein